MNKRLFFFITSKSNNDYYYNAEKQQLVFLHPILKYFILRYLEGVKIDMLSYNNVPSLNNYSPRCRTMYRVASQIRRQ